MTALVRIRLSGRALSSLGLLMLAAVLVIGAAGWGARASSSPVRSAMTEGKAVVSTEGPGQRLAERGAEFPSGDASVSGTTSSGGELGLLPQHLRLLVGSVIVLGLAGASQPYWVAILGLGLYASAAADRNRLRRLFSGCRHGTRAPPVCF
jgi:hypothetical protein